MIIECPRCTSRYEVADGLIGPAGKSVRCAKCSNVWLARPVGEADTAPPPQWPEAPQRAGGSFPTEIPVTPEPPEDPALAEFRDAQRPESGGSGMAGKKEGGGFARFPDPSEPPPPPRPRLGGAATIGWAVTVILLGAGAWAAYSWRDAVMEAWPPSQRVYLALGLGADPPPPASR
ncbi:zinc-ribbon domain-containing protein [Elioraea sp.]|uniref:zinc-ribbon domain-containing protein n=1 Tax=Elioraea sp. TaxID=2185103 RepID=UPI0025B9852A|nr:zinc-ribbon domain-containing protein [Elioraea sp.]